MPDSQMVINQTRKWLQTVVIAHRLCPFAKQEFDKGRIHYAVIEPSDLEPQLASVINHCIALDREPERETTLIIFPNGLNDFGTYLEVLDLANMLMKTEGYEGVYQLASFHPQYRFDGAAEDDPANYTNRSPYPMLHILREASVEAALASVPNPENIPTRNIALTRELGLNEVKAMFEACYK